jgi:signal transduction histidine kinase
MVGPLVCLLMVTAVVGVWLLEGTLTRLDYLNGTVMATTEQVNDLVIGIRDVRRGLHETALGHKNQFASMDATMNQINSLMNSLEQSDILHQATISAAMLPVLNRLPDFQQTIASISATPQVSASQVDAAIAAANSFDIDATRLAQLVRDEAHMEHQRLSDRLRVVVLVLCIVFLLAINLSIVALLRAAAMILRPVDSLVKVAHELGQEHFDARVQIDDDNEFGQLARAYNCMAQQLQSNEQRKMEVLGQVAATMSHELNNAMNVIELQLTLLSRRAGDSDALQLHLKQIRQSLRRMTGVVDAVRNTRRIVLTDYMEGIKMLDLRKSTQDSNVADELLPAGQKPGYDL